MKGPASDMVMTNHSVEFDHAPQMTNNNVMSLNAAHLSMPQLNIY